jgi:crotonobetainyl-CoA:carnitine CoA-transferase CaiB-like acyl-CoA transferase
MFAMIGILMALRHRDVNGGRGQVVDASILEGCFAMLESVVPEYDKLGVVREPGGTALANNAPSNLYRSRDDRWIVIGANSQNLWERLCKAIEREDLLEDERFADHQGRADHSDELDEIIGAWAAERDAAEIDSVLNEAGVVCSPVYSVADIFEDEHVRAREMLIKLTDGELGEIVSPGVVPVLSDTPGAATRAGPWELGEANREVYGERLGLDDDELARLSEEGVI